MKLKSLISAALIIGCYSFSASAQTINSETYNCQKAIKLAVPKFEDKIADAIEGCLLEVQLCNTQVGSPAVNACLAKLLVPNMGKCAVGKLSSTGDYFGPGSSTTAIDSSAIGKAYASFIKGLAKCSPSLPVDFAALNLSNPTPANINAVAEALNTNPDGVACLAHKRVLRSFPARDELAIQIIAHPDGGNAANAIVTLWDTGSSCR